MNEHLGQAKGWLENATDDDSVVAAVGTNAGNIALFCQSKHPLELVRIAKNILESAVDLIETAHAPDLSSGAQYLVSTAEECAANLTDAINVMEDEA